MKYNAAHASQFIPWIKLETLTLLLRDYNLQIDKLQDNYTLLTVCHS